MLQSTLVCSKHSKARGGRSEGMPGGNRNSVLAPFSQPEGSPFLAFSFSIHSGVPGPGAAHSSAQPQPSRVRAELRNSSAPPWQQSRPTPGSGQQCLLLTLRALSTALSRDGPPNTKPQANCGAPAKTPCNPRILTKWKGHFQFNSPAINRDIHS